MGASPKSSAPAWSRLLLLACLLGRATTWDGADGTIAVPEPPSSSSTTAAAAATAAAASRRRLRQSAHDGGVQLEELDGGGAATAVYSSSSGGGGSSMRAALAVGDTSIAGGCPPLTRELFAAQARDNLVMLTVTNMKQWDFFLNWLHYTKAAGIANFIVGALDEGASRAMTELGVPCFGWVDGEAEKLGLEWGEPGWMRLVWARVFILDKAIGWGIDVVVSDLDLVWLRDPGYLLRDNPGADLILSEDGGQDTNPKGDGGLERTGSVWVNFNTGAYLLRANAAVAAYVRAWREFYDTCPVYYKYRNDQACAYELMRQGANSRHPQYAQNRLWGAWGGRLWIGIIPVSVAMSAHTYQLQQLHKVQGVEPLVVHMTWTYGGSDGKRARLRDLGLWQDAPAYYSEGGFVSLEELLDVPELPAGYNSWNENEDMVAFHLAAVQAQLQQAYVGLALAVAARRAFLLPPFTCFADRLWYGVVRGRMADAQRMPFPVPCPQDYLFEPGRYSDNPAQFGTALQIREASFLGNERTPAEVKDSVLVLRPSAALDCADCVREEPGQGGGPPTLLLPPGLRFERAMKLLQPYARYRVWRLSLGGVGSAKRAFGGFDDPGAADRFDKRVQHITADWCCRREEEAPLRHQPVVLKLSMASDFWYSNMTA